MLRGLRTFLLICEAAIGFGPPALLLLAGLPLLTLSFSSLRLAGDGDFGVGVVLLYVGGVLGIPGAVMLTHRALRPGAGLRRARLALLLACCGVAALAAAASWLGVVPVLVVLLSLVITLHFVHIAMAPSSPLTTASTTRDLSIALLVIAIPVGLFFANRDRLEARADARDPCMEGPGGNMGLSIHVNLDEAEWPSFAATMQDFAREQGLLLYDGRQTNGDTSNILYLSLCNDAGTQLMTNEQHYRIGPEWDWSVDNDVAVAVYARDVAADWRETADALERKLETAWPGRVTRTDRTAGTD